MGLGLQHVPPAGSDSAGDAEGMDPAGPLARLRAQRKHLEEQEGTREFDHPGYDGMRVTYRRLGWEEFSQTLYGGDPEQTAVERNLQLLVASATLIEYVDDDGAWHKLSEGYDRRFAEMLKIDGDRAREWALGSFGWHEQPMLNHAAQVGGWMGALRKADKKELLGG